MIKVLHIWSSMSNGGVESVLLNIFSAIDKTKFECSLFLTEQKNVYEKELADLNIKIKSTTFPNKGGYKGSEQAYYEYFKANKNEIDIVHIHNQNTKCFFVARAAKKCGLAAVVHSHLQGEDNGLVHRICRFLVNRYTDLRIGCSKAAANYMFGNRRDTVIIKNAIHLDRFAFRQDERNTLRSKYNISDKFVVGHIGRFCEQKNHEKLLRIFAKVKDLRKDAVLVMVGWGEWEEKIKLLAASSPHSDSIIFLPPTNEVEKYYNIFDVFVFPSLREGLGIVGIEAQANGLPCFVSDTIPTEIKATSLLSFIPLDASDETWATAICNNSGRRDCTDEIINSGYEIKTSVEKLEKLYVKVVK